MADQFQIPQRNPQYVGPVAPPAELISQYLNRPMESAKMIQGAANDTYNSSVNQQKLKIGAFEAGGPALMDALYGGGKLPTQGQPSQGASQSQPQIQPTQAPGGQSDVPETIQATLNHPQLGAHAQKILALQNQMGQNLQMGKYGQTMNAGLKDQLGAETALMGAEQFQQGQDRQQKQFETSQAAEEDRFQRGEQNKIRGTIAGAQKDIRQKSTSTDTAQDALNTFSKTFLGKGEKGQLVDLTQPSKIPFLAGASATLASKTGGRFGNAQGGNMVERRKVLANAMVGILTSNGRISPQVANDMVEGLVPKPDELTQNKIEKLDELQRLIDTVKTGDKATIDNMIATLTNSNNSALRR